MEDEFEEQTLDPGRLIFIFFFGLIDIIEFIGILLNLTGYWIIFILILNLFGIFLYLGWRTITEGFSLSAIFGTWKQALWLIADQIPVIGDLCPGNIVFILMRKKKKIPTPMPAPPKK